MLTLPYMKLSSFEFLSLTQNLFSLYWREEVDYASSVIDGVIVVGLYSSIVVVFGVPFEVWKIVDTGLLEAMLALLTLAPEQLIDVPLMTWKQNCQIFISCIPIESADDLRRSSFILDYCFIGPLGIILHE